MEMVKKISAQLYLPNERRFPIRLNHTDMVKFVAPGDTNYKTVLKIPNDSLAEMEKQGCM